jgi:hypothetical protein
LVHRSVNPFAIAVKVLNAAQIDLNDQPGHLIRRAHQSRFRLHETLGRGAPVQYAVTHPAGQRRPADRVAIHVEQIATPSQGGRVDCVSNMVASDTDELSDLASPGRSARLRSWKASAAFFDRCQDPDDRQKFAPLNER